MMTPCAPFIETSSSSGLLIAPSAAWMARFSPVASPVPIIALPIWSIAVRISAKSRLTRPGTDHQIGHAAHAGLQNRVGHAEGFGKCGFFVGDTEEILVRDDDQRINVALHFLNAAVGLIHPVDAFEVERLRDNAYGQNALLAAGLGDDRRGARSGASAHARRNEGHVGAFQILHNFLKAFLGCGLPDFRLRACAQTARDVHAELHAVLREAPLQGLCVRVADDEFASLQIGRDHVVDGVAPGSADADDSDLGSERVKFGRFDFNIDHFGEPLRNWMFGWN
jgi:hypothetical protein